MIPIMREVHRAHYKIIVACMGSQMGKSASLANIMGHRLDDDPAPMLYFAPTRNMCEKLWEPAFKAMVDASESLSPKLRRGKAESKTLKVIAGVKVRFGWTGSASEVAGEPACKVFVDERDRMDSVPGEGDPVELGKARHKTYPDGQVIVTSTPLLGSVTTEVLPSGLEHWCVSTDEDENPVQSPTWQLWQEGTRYEWAVPCPDCHEYFIPRMRLHVWPDEGTPAQASAQSRLACPHCGVLIEQNSRNAMNARGRYVAPGQEITQDGEISGDPPDSNTASYWVSGLCSPWNSWQELAEQYITAEQSGDPDRLQSVVNTGYGELFSVSGDAPAEDEVTSLRADYQMGDLPIAASAITLAVDVGKHGLHYVVRAWGEGLESWGLEHGEILGETDGSSDPNPWEALATFRNKVYGENPQIPGSGLPIRRCFVDVQYNSDHVYSFCRRFPGWAYPARGKLPMDKPLHCTTVDVTQAGKSKRGGLSIWNVSSDFFKRWVHERFGRDETKPGAWHIASDYTDEFCKHMVSESRTVSRSGKVSWVKTGPNHYFDCEYLSVGAAYSLNLQRTLASEKPQNVRQGGQPETKRPPLKMRGSGKFSLRGRMR